MKAITSALWATIAVGSFISGAQGQGVKPQFTLSIASDKETIPSGSALFVKVTETNNSDQPLNCRWREVNSTNTAYLFVVRNSEGNDVPRKKGTRGMMGSFRGCELKPGESDVTENYLNWLYDFTKPGTYTIQASRRISDDEMDGSVRSNIITVTITP
jgi:hypothetical protein